MADYRRIRDLIADTIPGFKDFNEKIKNPGGFYLGNSAGARKWNTASGRANFRPNVLPKDLMHERTRATGRTAGPDHAVDALPRSVQHHDLWPG